MEKKKTGLLTRVISALLGFPLVLVVFIFANDLIFDIIISALSIMCMYEYFTCFKNENKANPSTWLGYIISVLIILLNFVDKNIMWGAIVAILPISILALATELFFSNGKKNIIDIAVTFLGICYIPITFFFLDQIRCIDTNGKIYLWYVIIAAWGSDTCAYFIGRNFGKHKFTKISPNKTIEGSVAGVIGALVIGLVYTVIINNVFSLTINYLAISIILIVLSVIGQIGDITASAIKRYCNVKDFSEIIPGHGGMLDRFDSVIFIIPFAYILLTLFII